MHATRYTAVTTPAFARTTASPKMMMPVEGADVAMSNVAANANVIASAAGDFGGYLFPIVGIMGLSALILYLSPPLADE